MSVKNLFIRWLIQALIPAHSRRLAPVRPKSILVVSTTGLGDTLWATPALNALRNSFPSSYISVLTSPIGEEILLHNKNIDELFVLNSPYFFNGLRLLPRLKKQAIDTIFLFHASQRLVLPLCALLGAGRFIGTHGLNKDLDFLLTHAIPPKLQHEIARRLELVREVGTHISEETLEFYIGKEHEKELHNFLKNRSIADHIPLVGLHPGAKNTFKQWSPECFIEVGRRLYQHMGCQIIVSGDQSEAWLVHEIASNIPEAIPMAGELPLGPYAALLKRLSLFITNDTGPMHLAFATRTPTVALFGPTDPRLCGPHQAKRVRVLGTTPTCRPCLRKACEEPFCLLQIGPDDVYKAALELYYNQSLSLIG